MLWRCPESELDCEMRDTGGSPGENKPRYEDQAPDTYSWSFRESPRGEFGTTIRPTCSVLPMLANLFPSPVFNNFPRVSNHSRWPMTSTPTCPKWSGPALMQVRIHPLFCLRDPPKDPHLPRSQSFLLPDIFIFFALAPWLTRLHKASMSQTCHSRSTLMSSTEPSQLCTVVDKQQY